jgi:hypothetical protein
VSSLLQYTFLLLGRFLQLSLPSFHSLEHPTSRIKYSVTGKLSF